MAFGAYCSHHIAKSVPSGWDVSLFGMPSVTRKTDLSLRLRFARQQLVVGNVERHLHVRESTKNSRRSIDQRRDEFIELVRCSEYFPPTLCDEEGRVASHGRFPLNAKLVKVLGDGQEGLGKRRSQDKRLTVASSPMRRYTGGDESPSR